MSTKQHISYSQDPMFHRITKSPHMPQDSTNQYQMELYNVDITQPVGRDSHRVTLSYFLNHNTRWIEDYGGEQFPFVTIVGSPVTKDDYLFAAFCFIKLRDEEEAGVGRATKRKISNVLMHLSAESQEKVADISRELGQFGDSYTVPYGHDAFKRLMDLPESWSPLITFICRRDLFHDSLFFIRVNQNRPDPHDTIVSPQLIEIGFFGGYRQQQSDHL